MAEKEIENVIRDLIDSLEKKDMNRALSFFTDDATWFTTQGTFRGRDEIKRYLAYMGNYDLKFTYDGVGILVQGNKAVSQSTYGATYKGTTIKVSNICTYEFSGDRIKNHWAMMDRLSMAKQFATGPIARKIVNSIIAQTEKGLR
jgi:uncharacterized protein (TIGR02246 family)